jgi:hypothetical protein
MEGILNIWCGLSDSSDGVLQLQLSGRSKEQLLIIAVVAFLLLIYYWKIRPFLRSFYDMSNLAQRLPDYTRVQIRNAIKYYIWPECQSVDPAQSIEIRSTIAVKNDLLQTIDRNLMQPAEYKHYMLLADTGMGKTSFLLNYLARHLRKWRKPYKMELIPLNVPGLQEKLAKIAQPQRTVLLLDALDEDVMAVHDHVARLADIMQWTKQFHRVVLTCRTQFFPRDEEITPETGILKSGPRTDGMSPQFTFYKIYLTPFSDQQVQIYLDRRFPIWRKKWRKEAHNIVSQAPNLIVRPMLLAYVQDLIHSKKSIKTSFQIYEQMVEAWVEREQRKGTEKDKLRTFSEKLAVELFFYRADHGGERIAKEQIGVLAQMNGIDLELWQLTGRSLLNRDAVGNYKFAHRSILEYLVALMILKQDSAALSIPVAQLTDQMKIFIMEGIYNEPCPVKYWTPVIKNLVYNFQANKPLILPDKFVRFDGGVFSFSRGDQFMEMAPFDMSRYPVTNKEFEEFNPDHKDERDKYSETDDQPVVHVSYDEAKQYCEWLSERDGCLYRVPTEAEWEFAASGCGQREFPWGNESPNPTRANYADSKIGKTTPVGSFIFGTTPEGLFDMAGNVWEWCADWFDQAKDSRVLRGGYWGTDANRLRNSYRDWLNPQIRNLGVVGFRVLRVVK